MTRSSPPFMRNTAKAFSPIGLAHACRPPAERLMRLPGLPTHSWFTAMTRVLVMIGHARSIFAVFERLNERMSGLDMIAHAPKWERSSVIDLCKCYSGVCVQIVTQAWGRPQACRDTPICLRKACCTCGD